VNAKVVLAAPSVPVGSYARTVLRNLGISAAVLGKVVSNESDVKGVVGKIALGQGDAGFVYATDVKPVADQVTAIKIPAWAQPRVRYEIAVVSKSPNKKAAQAWVKGILGKKGQAALAAAGFLPIPGSRS
jgi:molybdenum ABC transporter, periplasmic molybdate-binding protein